MFHLNIDEVVKGVDVLLHKSFHLQNRSSNRSHSEMKNVHGEVDRLYSSADTISVITWSNRNVRCFDQMEREQFK